MHEKAAVRLAGVTAMARLAHDWGTQRQMCVDVLCAYLLMPFDASYSEEIQVSETLAVLLQTTFVKMKMTLSSGIIVTLTCRKLL
ncbi:hypothetical protein [Acidithrix sp. C25]|uniref:hypothetical protein n=1 Tax=Acidithrix sp. C25 TaxID=1671482 RepID=UPI00191B9CF7|nr:hypothetical protein [Acidithrix sp. C25]